MISYRYAYLENTLQSIQVLCYTDQYGGYIITETHTINQKEEFEEYFYFDTCAINQSVHA